MKAQELTQIQILTSDVFNVASEPHISIDFKKDGESFFVEIAAQDALNFIRSAGRYAYERIVSHEDGQIFVIEIQGEEDHEVRVKIEDRLESLSKKDLDAIVRKAMVCPDYRESIQKKSSHFNHPHSGLGTSFGVFGRGKIHRHGT